MLSTPLNYKLNTHSTHYGVIVGLEMMERRPKEIFVTPEDAGRLMCYSWQNVGLTVDIAHLNTFGDPINLFAEIDPKWVAHVIWGCGLLSFGSAEIAKAR